MLDSLQMMSLRLRQCLFPLDDSRVKLESGQAEVGRSFSHWQTDGGEIQSLILPVGNSGFSGEGFTNIYAVTNSRAVFAKVD